MVQFEDLVRGISFETVVGKGFWISAIEKVAECLVNYYATLSMQKFINLTKRISFRDIIDRNEVNNLIIFDL